MDIKILKKLNKKFDKEWETLSSSEKKACVEFMLDTLKEADSFYKSSLIQLIKAKASLNEIIDDNTKDTVKTLKQIVELMTKKKVAKEDKLQAEIMSSNNRQLLFSDILTTYKAFDKASESIKNILGQTKVVVNNGATSISTNKLATLVVQVESLAESHERYVNVFANQTDKVKELFADYIKTNDNELSL